MQQILKKMQESVSSHQETDKDEEAETVTNVSDGSVSLVTEKLNEITRADTTPSADNSFEKNNSESSQENLNPSISGKFSTFKKKYVFFEDHKTKMNVLFLKFFILCTL